MGSVPTPGGASSRLDRPPGPSDGPTGPTSSQPGAAPGSADPMMGGMGGMGGGQDPQAVTRALVAMGGEVDRALVAMAQAISQSGGEAQGIAQARQLIEQDIARVLATAGAAPSSSPTAAGPQMPGAGMSGGMI